LSEAAEIIGVIRDIAIVLILLLAMIVLIVVFRKVSAALDSARRAVKSAEEVAAALATRIVGPAAAGSGVAFGAGKLAAFVLGWSSKRRKKGGGTDGQR
jgi:hypothetical protein